MGVYGLGSTMHASMHAASNFWHDPSRPEAEPHTPKTYEIM
jgi:hypothetical protein